MSEIILGWDRGQEAPRIGFARPAVSRERGTLIADGSESHVLAIAPTGKGKSRCLVIPNLLHWQGSSIVLDIKGELTAVTARYRREGLGQQVVVLDPWGITGQESGTLNPLDTMTHDEDLGDDAFMFASMLSPVGSRREPFWQERAETLIAALIAALVSRGGDTATLGRVSDLLLNDDPVYRLAQWLDDKKPITEFARQLIASFINLPEITRGGILSTACSHMRNFAGARIKRATGRSSFDLEMVTRGDPLTIYLVVPPANLLSHASVIRLWLASLMGLVMRRRRRPALPTLFILDELAQLGPMPQIQTAITLSRSYGMRCFLIFQSFSQLRQLYPTDYLALIENCGHIVTFGHTSRTMSAELATMLGDMTLEALRAMGKVDAALRTGDDDTRIIRRLDYLDDALFQGRADRNPFFTTHDAPTR